MNPWLYGQCRAVVLDFLPPCAAVQPCAAAVAASDAGAAIGRFFFALLGSAFFEISATKRPLVVLSTTLAYSSSHVSLYELSPLSTSSSS